MMERSTLIEYVQDARQRTLDLVADLTDDQLLGPCVACVNPLLWEIGHVAWFQEKWVLRQGGRHESIRSDADAIYDSVAIPHDDRWDLALPPRRNTIGYIGNVRDRVIDLLNKRGSDDELTYFVLLSVFHEDMHTEAFTCARQTCEYPPPKFTIVEPGGAGQEPGAPSPGAAKKTEQPRAVIGQDVAIPGGRFLLGAGGHEPFVFDNEKLGHVLEVRPFAIATTPVTQAQFAGFVDDDGYHRSQLWSEKGWQWRGSDSAEHPVYWRCRGNGWERRYFNVWRPLEPDLPVIHVNWYEAEAFCRWAGRRLPTEAEWELAATGCSDGDVSLPSTPSTRKRRFPWGDDPPHATRANLDWGHTECVSVSACPDGDSPFGCRQMIGNVWEWTASEFLPYPGFEPGPYKEFSQPWFGTHKVLRGGGGATRSRLLRNTWRNFYKPDRRDLWSGFRTCAVD